MTTTAKPLLTCAVLAKQLRPSPFPDVPTLTETILLSMVRRDVRRANPARVGRIERGLRDDGLDQLAGVALRAASHVELQVSEGWLVGCYYQRDRDGKPNPGLIFDAYDFVDEPDEVREDDPLPQGSLSLTTEHVLRWHVDALDWIHRNKKG